MTLLSDYEVQVSDLLHDPYNERFTIAQVDRYINEARRRLVGDTGCLRVKQVTYVTFAQEQYLFGQVSGGVIVAGGQNYVNPTVTFSGGGGTGVAATLTQTAGSVTALTFTSFGSGYTSAPTATITDTGGGTGAQINVGVINFNTYAVFGINLIYANLLVPLFAPSYPEFNVRYRRYIQTVTQQRPVAWTIYGNRSIFLGPPPDQSYQIELDTLILPTDLATGDFVTNDPIPLQVQDPIKYYAAYLAQKSAQKLGEASSLKNDYEMCLMECTDATLSLRIPNPYEA